MSFRIHRPVRGDCLDQQEPVFLCVMDDDIGHLAVLFQMHTQFAESSFVKAGKFRVGIANVKNAPGRRPARVQFGDDGSDESAACTTRKLHGSCMLDSLCDTGLNKGFQSLTDAFGVEW